MANKTRNNYNEMRPAIIAMHNAGNTKAITKDFVAGANVDLSFFSSWITDVNALRKTVQDYVIYKKAQKVGNKVDGRDITPEEVYAARERIFPKWKEILSVGEKNAKSAELHVDESDVEDLVGFAWDFMSTDHGTVEHVTTEQIFRKKVESLLGCIIARNEILTDSDRDTIQEYHKAQSRVQKLTDKAAELDGKKTSLNLILGGIPDTEEKFKEYITNQITAVEDEIKANKEAKAEADGIVAEVSAKATPILKRIQSIK